MKNERLLHDLVEEKNQLERRLTNLSFFIHCAPAFKDLSTKRKRLLCMQYETMKTYSFLLELRIDDLEKGSL